MTKMRLGVGAECSTILKYLHPKKHPIDEEEVCCMLYVVCCMLYVVCCMLYVMNVLCYMDQTRFSFSCLNPFSLFSMLIAQRSTLNAPYLLIT
jgi:hypothetical protein